MTRTRQFLVPVLATLGALATLLGNSPAWPVWVSMLALVGIIWTAALSEQRRHAKDCTCCERC